MAQEDALRREIFGQNGFAAKLRERILSPQSLAEETQRQVLGRFPHGVECANVNAVLCDLLDGEYHAYLALEKKAFESVVAVALESPEYALIHSLVEQCCHITQEQSASPEERVVRVGQLLAPIYKLVSESFAQSRRTRAGSSAQYLVAYILDHLGYKGEYEIQRILNGTVDFLFPNYALWQKDRRRCTILSIKRTLRERYKQVYEELGISRGLTVYLMATATEEEAQRDFTLEKIDNLNAQNVYLVVRDSIKLNRFSQSPNVRGFTQFFCDDLPRLRTNWRGALSNEV